VDGDLTTYWRGGYNEPQCIAVDLGSSTEIGRAVIRWVAGNNYLWTYTIRYSDAAPSLNANGSLICDSLLSWSVAYDSGPHGGTGGTEVITFPPRTARYFAIHGTEDHWGAFISELELYAPGSLTPLMSLAVPLPSDVAAPSGESSDVTAAAASNAGAEDGASACAVSADVLARAGANADVDGDRVLNFLDALVVAKVAVGASPFGPPLLPEEQQTFDLNRDGRVDFLDALLAAKAAVDWPGSC